jgi:hypothetical protein
VRDIMIITIRNSNWFLVSLVQILWFKGLLASVFELRKLSKFNISGRYRI